MMTRFLDRTRRVTPNLSLVSLLGVFLLGSVILAAAPWETAGQASTDPARLSSGARSQETANLNVVPTSAAQDSLADSPPLGQTRILHFPEDRSLGKLSVQTGPMERYTLNVHFSQFAQWEYVGQAIGSVTVPADGRVMLETHRSAGPRWRGGRGWPSRESPPPHLARTARGRP